MATYFELRDRLEGWMSENIKHTLNYIGLRRCFACRKYFGAKQKLAFNIPGDYGWGLHENYIFHVECVDMVRENPRQYEAWIVDSVLKIDELMSHYKSYLKSTHTKETLKRMKIYEIAEQKHRARKE